MSTAKQLPFMSVVVTLYNKGESVGRAIEALLAQDYPADRYEIIVVEDGSTDRGPEIIAQYPVRIARHGCNLGLSAARDTGLQLAVGDIYVCFDADCVVTPNWLSSLALAYEQKPNALGVGSVLIGPEHVSGLVERFMGAADSGAPPPLTLGQSKQPLQRFVAYVRNQLGLGRTAVPTEPYAVRELYGASATFPVAALRAAGGWDRSLRWLEDVYICSELRRAFPDRQFFAVPAAQLVHDPKMPLGTFLRRPYTRGLTNLQHYRRNGLTPPVFPFPFAWLGLCTFAAIINPLAGVAALILAPQLLYMWWPVRAVRERNLWYLAFPYLQLAEELSTVAGLVRGYVILRREARHA